MRGRPPKKTLTPDQQAAASAFVDAAEAPDSGSGRAEAVAPEAAPAPRTRRSSIRRPGGEERPWEADYVREDVVKGYALRLPEPLYLKLKWVADQTGRSMNAVCREAVEAEVEGFLASDRATR